MGVLHVDVDYPHRPAKVWRALTDSAAMAEWLMPNDFEPRVGHEFTLRTDPAPGFDGIVHCRVLELVDERKLSFTWRGGPLNTVITFELEEIATGTKLRVTQTGFEGLRANMVRLILQSGSKKIYNQLLPDVLNRMGDDGQLAAMLAESTECENRGFWRVLAFVFSPVLGRKPKK